MTNEQMCEFIKQGGSDDLKIVLWERVKKVLYKLSNEFYGNNTALCVNAGVEIWDIKQVAYFAYLKAIEGFKPQSGLAFTTYLNGSVDLIIYVWYTILIKQKRGEYYVKL